MADVRTSWMNLYEEIRHPNLFLSRLFTMKPGGQFDGAKVLIDIQRFGQDVATVVKCCTGPNLNEVTTFETSEFSPPCYGEAVPVDICDLMDRLAGVKPCDAQYVSYNAQLIRIMAQAFRLIEAKIQRAMELQAAQILQTGKLSLVDSTSETVYELDFQARPEHFPTVTTSWGDVGATVKTDIEALAQLIRMNSGVSPDTLICGTNVPDNLFCDEEIAKCLDNRAINVGTVDPKLLNSGATHYGRLALGSYPYDIFTYPETYKDPVTGDVVNYIDPDTVIMLSRRNTRLDKLSARVPKPIATDPRVKFLMPGRMIDRSLGLDLTPNVYASLNGKEIMGELETRALLAPITIDGFGAIKTVA